MEESSAILATRLAAGDPTAPQDIYDRYVARLLALIRPCISQLLSARLDAEDVTQSAFRSFFRRTEAGELELGRGAPLWRLLAAIAHHKLLKQVEHHLAGLRSPRRETVTRGECHTSGEFPDEHAADPQHAAALAEELECVLSQLDPLVRRIVELRLQDYALDEVARVVGRSERTVRRLLGRVEDQIRERLTGP